MNPRLLPICLTLFLYIAFSTGVSHGAIQLPDDPNKRLMSAARSEEITEVESALNEGADVNLRDEHGSTPLMIAAHVGNLMIVRLLLDRGAYLYAQAAIQSETANQETA